jgi:polyferredoxin
MFSVPLVATLLSLRERRYWCKRVCPVGAFLGAVGALNPFIKPRVTEERCVMKGCPEDCEDGRLDFCFFCRATDDRQCEKVCPVDINLVDHGSLRECTKCLECYIVCDYSAVEVGVVGKPDVFRIGSVLERLKVRWRASRQKKAKAYRENTATWQLRS